MTVTGDKEGHYIMINGSLQQENLMVLNIYALNIEAPKYIKQNLIQLKEINCNIIVVGNFNMSLSIMDRLFRKINKETDLNNSIDQMGLTDIYRTFYP